MATATGQGSDVMQERSADETAAFVAVQRLQAAYGDAVTRRAWHEVRGLFTPDAVVDIDTRDPQRAPIHLAGPGEIAEFVERALERFTFFEFAVLNAVADVDGDDGWGRMYICELRHAHDGEWTQAFGLYQDHYRCHDGRWSIASRHYHSLARTGAQPVSFPLPPIRPTPPELRDLSGP